MSSTLSLDVVPVGTFFVGDATQEVRELVQLGQIELEKNLNLAHSSDPDVIWAAIRPHIERTVHFDMFGYPITAFMMKHEGCMQALKEKFPDYKKFMESSKYWVFNSAAPDVENPSIAFSNEIEEDFAEFPAYHEAFENAIMLQGVRIDGKIVPKEGRCAIATKVEINYALDRMTLSDLVRYLRTREQMFAAMGDGEEFKCSLALIRQVLTIINPS